MRVSARPTSRPETPFDPHSGAFPLLESHARTSSSETAANNKIKVDRVNTQTNEPLRIVDEKSRFIKYQIIA